MNYEYKCIQETACIAVTASQFILLQATVKILLQNENFKAKF